MGLGWKCDVSGYKEMLETKQGVAMTARVGPMLYVEPSKLVCRGCAKLRSEYFCVEDGNDCDSGFNYYCDAAGGRELDSDWGTPEWCPMMQLQEASPLEAKCRALAKSWREAGNTEGFTQGLKAAAEELERVLEATFGDNDALKFAIEAPLRRKIDALRVELGQANARVGEMQPELGKLKSENTRLTRELERALTEVGGGDAKR